MREVDTRKAVTVSVILEENSSSSYQGGVSHDEEEFGDVRDKKYGGGGED